MSAASRPARRHFGPSALRAIIAAAVALAPVVAGAQQKSRAGDAATAEVLWKEGRRLKAAGKIKEACPKFVESYRLDPALGTLLNMASCHELEGKLATAWGEYRDAEQQALRADDKRRKFAAEHAEALEPRVPYLLVRVSSPAEGLVVTRDGEPLADAALGISLPVDPGAHEIAADAPGREPWSTTIQVASGQKVEVRVPPLERVEATEAPPPPLPDAAADASSSSGGTRTAGFVIGGLGVAALAVGGVFGGLTAGQAGVADENCPDKVCNAAGADAVSQGKTFAWASNIGFAAGAVAVLVGGYLILTGGEAEPDAPAASVSLTPVVGPGVFAGAARLVF